mgnify:CR=1 FL=1
MKILTSLAASIALSVGALSVQASEQADRDLQECLSELRGIYGEDTQLHLVDRRRNQHGTRMRVAAQLDSDNSYFANCWVARYDQGDFDYEADGQALAATGQSVIGR